MANDCAVVQDFADGHREYSTGRKFFLADGIGCVTMWGARDGNKLVSYLSSLTLTPTSHTVDDLIRQVNRFLIEQYAPHEVPLSDIGFHVGGFTSDGQPRLCHIFWNVPGSSAAVGTEGTYTFQFHHPSLPLQIKFLYNGRNELVSAVIGSLITELNKNSQTKFPFTPVGMCRLSHFILRFGAELTPEVSPPFLVHLLSPNRKCVTKRVDEFGPVQDEYFRKEANLVGLWSSGGPFSTTLPGYWPTKPLLPEGRSE